MRFIILAILFVNSIFAMDIQDMFNRDVTIKNSKKIVCLGPGSLRLITYLNLQENLVGIEKVEKKYDLKAPYRAALNKKQIKSLPIVGQGGPGKMPNLETLITLKPDVIFTSFLSKEQVELIQSKTKVPVIALSYGATYGGVKKDSKLQAIKKSLKLIAKITNKIQRADELIAFMELQEKELHTLKLQNKKVYIGGIGYKGAQGITSTESHYPSFELLHLKNDILKDQKGHFFINKEALLTYNPDLIFLDFLGKKIINEELSSNNILKTIQAFQQNKVYWLYPYNFYNTNIENLFVNSWLIASYFDKNIDFKAKEKEIYTIFLGERGIQTFIKEKPYKL
jgi:iron complex transport system substrate-binding protein